jgi:LL-diaminopimelate aminotransferase
LKLSARTQKLPPYFFAQLDQTIARYKAEGKDVIRLDIGSPDMPPPTAVIETLCRSANNPTVHGYQPHAGAIEYRQAWSNFYRRYFSVELDPKTEFSPLLGSKEGIFHFTQVMVDPGDVVIMPSPHYPTYLRSTQYAGGEPYEYPLRSGDNFKFDLKTIPESVLKRAKMMWVNFPNNPTGATTTLAFFEELVAWARKHDILLCSDAAYCQVYYDGIQPPNIFQVSGAKEIAVEFNSLSKSFNMAGWRIGALVGNAELIKAHQSFKTSIDSGQFRPMIDAAITALNTDPAWIEHRNQVYQERRDVVIKHLDEIGINVPVPKAALYLWVPIPAGKQAFSFALELLEKTGVSVSPGTVFGEGGEGFIRISIVQPLERLEEGLRRLQSYLKQ